MGYIVGRNSSAGGVETARNEKGKTDRGADSTDIPNPDTPSDDTSTAPALDAPPAPAQDSTPPASTKPAQSESARPEAGKPERAPARPPQAESKPKPSPAPAPATRPPAAPIHAPAAGEPASGRYWQVVATMRPDAEIIAEALGKKGFHVILAPTPNKNGLFRVLVGPLPDASTQASTRTSLESAGFKNPILRNIEPGDLKP